MAVRNEGGAAARGLELPRGSRTQTGPRWQMILSKNWCTHTTTTRAIPRGYMMEVYMIRTTLMVVAFTWATLMGAHAAWSAQDPGTTLRRPQPRGTLSHPIAATNTCKPSPSHAHA